MLHSKLKNIFVFQAAVWEYLWNGLGNKVVKKLWRRKWRLSAATRLFTPLCARSAAFGRAPLSHWLMARPSEGLGRPIPRPKIMCVVEAQKDCSPWKVGLNFVTPLQNWKNTCWNEMGLQPLLKVKPRWLYFRVAEARGPFGWTICIFGSISALRQWLSLALSSTLL